jgi:hypothetical protein
VGFFISPLTQTVAQGAAPREAIRLQRIAPLKHGNHNAAMPGIIFWIIVIAIVVFFKVTTKKERHEMIVNYWIIIAIIGVLGFGYQLLTTGSL